MYRVSSMNIYTKGGVRFGGGQEWHQGLDPPEVLVDLPGFKISIRVQKTSNALMHSIYIHTHTHTHTHIYIHVCVCVCIIRGLILLWCIEQVTMASKGCFPILSLNYVKQAPDILRDLIVGSCTLISYYYWRSGFHSICPLAESSRRSVEPIPVPPLPGLSCKGVGWPGDTVPIFTRELSDSGLRGTAGRSFSVPASRDAEDPASDSKVSRRGGSMGFFLISWTGSVFLFFIEPGLGTQSTSAENGLDLRVGFGIYPCFGGCTVAFTDAPVIH